MRPCWAAAVRPRALPGQKISDHRHVIDHTGSTRLPTSTICDKYGSGPCRTLPTRIPYAEREPATSRVGPMVLFDLRPSRTNWPRALPGGVHKKFSILFVQSVLYYHQRAPGWADPGRIMKINTQICCGQTVHLPDDTGSKGMALAAWVSAQKIILRHLLKGVSK